jgi:phage shock protein C
MATLVRPRQGKIIAGVCAGLAMRFGISVTLIRVAFVVFAVTGVGELVYLILWGGHAEGARVAPRPTWSPRRVSNPRPSDYQSDRNLSTGPS